MDLDVVWLHRMNRKAKEEIEKEQIRAQWTAMLPMMSANILKYMTWEDYYDQASGRDIDLRPASEILAEVQQIREDMKKGK